MKLVSQSQAVERIGSQVEPIHRKRKMKRRPRWDRIFLLFVAITFIPLMYWILTLSEKPEVIAQHVVERQDDVTAYNHARIKIPSSNTTETSRGTILKREEEVVKKSVSNVSNDRSDYKSYDKTEVSDRIYNYFRSRGYSHAATIGIMANLKHESQFDPGVHEYGGGPGRGLAQWGGGRFNNLVAYAESKGEHWSDLDTQLEFLEGEIESPDINNRMAGHSAPSMLYNNGVAPVEGGVEGFKKLDDPETATRVFEATMERSGGNGMSDRVKQTNSLHEAYNK